MTQYDEYLQYLKHVDDTTLQDFEKEKRKLQDDITAIKNQILLIRFIYAASVHHR